MQKSKKTCRLVQNCMRLHAHGRGAPFKAFLRMNLPISGLSNRRPATHNPNLIRAWEEIWEGDRCKVEGLTATFLFFTLYNSLQPLVSTSASERFCFCVCKAYHAHAYGTGLRKDTWHVGTNHPTGQVNSCHQVLCIHTRLRLRNQKCRRVWHVSATSHQPGRFGVHFCTSTGFLSEQPELQIAVGSLNAF